MARIGVDARPLANPTDGIARYTFEVLSRLLENQRHQWFLYSHRPLRSKLEGAQVRIAPRHFNNSLLSSQVLFSSWAQADGLNAYWSPRHHLPVRLKCPSLVTIHDLCWHTAPATMPLGRRIVEHLLSPRAMSQAHRISAVSHATASDITQLYPKFASKLTVISPGTQAFPSPTQLKFDKPFLLSVGTIEPRKNHNLLIDAFSRVVDKLPHNLVIIGRPGWQGIELDKLINNRGLQARVQWLPGADDNVLSTYYANAEALVSTSLYEGFNLPLLEAITQNLPIVATDIPVHREVAGACALYAKPDSDVIADKLIQILTDEQLRSELRSHCKSTAAKFDWQQTAAKTLAELAAMAC